MTRFKKPLLALAAVLAGVAVTVWLLERPKRLTQEFAGHLYHERYEDAAQMLRAPCVIRLAADRSMTIVDHTGASTTVPAERLPFMVGGGDQDHSSDFSMTALQGSTNRILDPPAVIIYLSIEGGKIRIDSVDS